MIPDSSGPTSRIYFSQRLRLHYVDWGNPAAPPLASLAVAPRLLGPLARWVERARRDGLDAEQIRMLLEVALDEPAASADDRRAAGGAA